MLILFDENLKVLLDLIRFQAYSKSTPVNRVVLREALLKPLRRRGGEVWVKV